MGCGQDKHLLQERLSGTLQELAVSRRDNSILKDENSQLRELVAKVSEEKAQSIAKQV